MKQPGGVFGAVNRGKRAWRSTSRAEGERCSKPCSGCRRAGGEFLPGTMERWGGYDGAWYAISALIYCAISGFGADGRWRTTGYDAVLQAMSG